MENPGKFLLRSPKLWDRKGGFHLKSTTATPRAGQTRATGKSPSATEPRKPGSNQRGVRGTSSRAEEQVAEGGEGQEATEHEVTEPTKKRKGTERGAKPRSATASAAQRKGASGSRQTRAGGKQGERGVLVTQTGSALGGSSSQHQAITKGIQLHPGEQEQVRLARVKQWGQHGSG
jgi:hypothetical protein